jgi:hypothetical protein
MKIILVALFAGIIAAAPQNTLKTRLGQKGAKNLAQSENPVILGSHADECNTDMGSLGSGSLDLPSLDVSCPCTFTELPGLGAGLSQGFQQHVEATQVQELAAVPDTQYNQICQSNCCECAEAAHAAVAFQAKNRTFTIQGAISVLERVTLAERERSAENSESKSEKQTVCVTNNQNGGLGANQECITVEVCPPGLNAVPPVKAGKIPTSVQGPIVKLPIGSVREGI